LAFCWLDGADEFAEGATNIVDGAFLRDERQRQMLGLAVQ
jgi:hypothetical protein